MQMTTISPAMAMQALLLRDVRQQIATAAHTQVEPTAAAAANTDVILSLSVASKQLADS